MNHTLTALERKYVLKSFTNTIPLKYLLTIHMKVLSRIILNKAGKITVWKVSKYGVFLFRILTLFKQWKCLVKWFAEVALNVLNLEIWGQHLNFQKREPFLSSSLFPSVLGVYANKELSCIISSWPENNI